MLTIVERVLLLQDVDVFSEVPTEQLALLAAVAEEEAASAGQTLYAAQTAADAMYLVISGRVRLHRDDLEITVAGPGQAFGTWALFDDEPRVSAAIAVEDCALLRLGVEDFVDLLADDVRITQGVLKALVRRVRGLLDRVGGAAAP